jgi:hypothetical protein
MNIVFDTDILSCIAKIKGFDFIKEVFPKSEYIVPGRVYEEILKAKKYGYDFSAYIIDLIDESVLSIPNLTAEEGQKIRDIESRDRIKIKNKEYLFNKIHEKNPEH